MLVTEVRIKKLAKDHESKLKGYATVTFDSVLTVHNIRIVEGKDGLFIAMPNRRLGNGEVKDVVHPIDTGFREYLKKCIVDAYNALPDEDAGQNG